MGSTVTCQKQPPKRLQEAQQQSSGNTLPGNPPLLRPLDVTAPPKEGIIAKSAFYLVLAIKNSITR